MGQTESAEPLLADDEPAAQDGGLAELVNRLA
jgi:hypothetical protein